MRRSGQPRQRMQAVRTGDNRSGRAFRKGRIVDCETITRSLRPEIFGGEPLRPSVDMARAVIQYLRYSRRRELVMKTSARFDLVDLRLFLFAVEAASINAWCRAGGYGSGIGQRTNSADGGEPRRTTPRTASPRRPHNACRRSHRPSRSAGHSAVGTDAWGIVRICQGWPLVE
jgi:hypothetical protein